MQAFTFATSKPESGADWKFVIESNEKRADLAKIIIDGENIAVYWAEHLILQVAANTPQEAAVTFLDLTPIGLNVHGDMRQLLVGTNSFIGNTFKNVATMIRL